MPQAEENPLLSEESMEALSRRAQVVYEGLKPSLESGQTGQIIAIHPDSGDYETGPRHKRPQVTLRKRHPDGGLIVTRQIDATGLSSGR